MWSASEIARGADAAARLSTDQQQVPLLASIPLSVSLRAGGDDGIPIVLSNPDDPAAVAIAVVAELLAGRGPRPVAEPSGR